MLFKATHRIASTADCAAAAQFGSYAGRGLREAQQLVVRVTNLTRCGALQPSLRKAIATESRNQPA
jgi:hypothetical protein